MAEEALAEGVPSADGNDGLVEEAVAEEAVAEEVAVDDGDALEPAPEAAESEALAADEPAPAEETAEEPAS